MDEKEKILLKLKVIQAHLRLTVNNMDNCLIRIAELLEIMSQPGSIPKSPC